MKFLNEKLWEQSIAKQKNQLNVLRRKRISRSTIQDTLAIYKKTCDSETYQMRDIDTGITNY